MACLVVSMTLSVPLSASHCFTKEWEYASGTVGNLALAALRSADQVHKVVDFERYLRSILSRQSSKHTISELVSLMQ